MSAVAPVGIAAPQSLGQVVASLGTAPAAQAPQSFSSLLSGAIHSMETKVAHADQMVKSFALNDGIPVHQVTYALEQARLSVELAMQVRSRLLEGYRELMNMQL